MINVSAIYGVTKLAESNVLKPYLYKFEIWFLTPLHLNLVGAFKALINGAIYLSGLPLTLLSYLMNLVFQADVVHLNTITDLIQGVVSRVPAPMWAQIAIVRPADLVPFNSQILSFINGSDIVLVITLSVAVTAAITWATAWIAAKDIPLTIAQKLNQRRGQRVYQQMMDLKLALLRLDLNELPANRETTALREMARLFDIGQAI